MYSRRGLEENRATEIQIKGEYDTEVVKAEERSCVSSGSER